MNLHPIDKPFGQRYNDKELEQFIVFLILDRANLYETVCKAYDILAASGFVTRDDIRRASAEDIAACIRAAGHRFPNQSAKYIKEFGDNQIDLRLSTRDQLVDNIKGIGYKLASMFVRNTRGEKTAVIDVHIKAFLQNQGYDIKGMTYFQMEDAFFEIADSMGLNPTDLDLAVWDAYRKGGKKDETYACVENERNRRDGSY